MNKVKLVELLDRLKSISIAALADSDIIDEIDEAITFVTEPTLIPDWITCGATGHTGCRKCRYGH
jgi:hypothetical protein